MKARNETFGLARLGFATAMGISLAIVLSGCGNTGNRMSADANMPTASEANNSSVRDVPIKMEVPDSIAAEHKELHEELEKAINSGGKTGEAAKVVEERLKPHFEKEEEYALPQLGLLVPLAEGKTTSNMNDAIRLSEKLKAEMPKMHEEHKAIVQALEQMTAAGRAENKPQAVAFADHLMAHAENEEQIMYPAAILVGEYLKLKLK